MLSIFMVKCEVCKEKVEETFLGKINGTFLRNGKKLRAVCSNCQKKLNNDLSKL